MGNECGHPVFQPYTKLLNADADAFVFFVPLVAYKFHTIAEAYALPSSGTNKIARLKLSSKFKLFGFITVSKAEYDNTGYASGTQMAVDGVPGALNPFVYNVPQFNGGVTLFPLLFLFWTHVDAELSGSPTNFTFVPTASALDVDPFNSSALNDKYVNGSNPTYKSSSETFISQETNASAGITNNFHIRFTARNSQWLYNEMESLNNNLNCSSECLNSYYISGNDFVCSGSSKYFIPGLPRGAIVTWTASPSNIVTPATFTGNPVTFTRIGSGFLSLTASVTNACGGGSYNLSKQITVGTPKPVLTATQVSQPGEPTKINVYASSTYGSTTPIPGATYHWYLDGTLMSASSNLYVWYIPCGETSTLECEIVNSCGTSAKASLQETGGCRQRGGATYMMAPNPATNDVTISADNSTETSSSPHGISSIMIYDQQGVLKKQFKYKKIKQLSFSVSDLPTGIYIVEISDGEFKERKQLIIKK